MMKLLYLNLANRYKLLVRDKNVSCVLKKRASKCCGEIFLPEVSQQELHNKIALVNDGWYGVGLSCVRELINCGIKGIMIAGTDETKGKNVITNLNTEYPNVQLAFIRSNPIHDTIIKHVYAETLKHFGTLDIVVNHIHHLQNANWDQQIQVNITGLIRNTIQGIKKMSTKNGGSGGIVINALSMGEHDSVDQCPLFLGIKHFILTFTRTLGLQCYDKTNVKIVTLCFEDNSATSSSTTSANLFQDLGTDFRTVICSARNGSIWIG